MTAIYQRARPGTFGQVIGQAHVTDILAVSVEQGRVGHAYLLSGPRGVGKTSTARLLAAAVNCEAATGRPCGECESCRLVRDGAHPDIVELDAASNNSVEDIRDMREKIGLASLRGGHRVWILDEAHMLSRAAANALLKTLEEPPPGLMFILATTEPEKLPPTVLSRCQHYRFRRLSDEEIASKLARLATEAGVEAEAEALALVARAAEGAMRDAESLLERLLSPGARIEVADVTLALGLPPADRLRELARALADADLGAAFAAADGLYRDGFSPRTLAERLAVTLRDELVAVLRGDGMDLGLDEARLMRAISTLDEEQERFVRRDDLYSLEVALIKAAGSLAGAAAPAAPAAEATVPAVAAAAGLPAFDPLGPAPRRPAAGEPAGREAVAAPDRSATPATDQAQERTPAPALGASTGAGQRKAVTFHALKSAASGQLRAFLMPAEDVITDSAITLNYPERYKFHFTQLNMRREELEQLIERVAGPGITLVINGPGGSAAPKKA